MPDQPTPTQPIRDQAINGLRQLADYLASHPDVPVNEYGWEVLVFSHQNADTDGRAEIDAIATALGVQPHDETPDDGHYTASKIFDRVTYRALYVPERSRAEHRAFMSYSGAVTPDRAPARDETQAA